MLSLTEKEFHAYLTLEDAIPQVVRIVSEKTCKMAVMNSGACASLFAGATSDKKYVVRHKKQLDNMEHFASLIDVAEYTGLDDDHLKDTFKTKHGVTVAFDEWIVTKRLSA